MSKLEELIADMCPQGVEYRELSSFSTLIKGMSGVSNKWKEEGNCRFIDYKNAYNHLKIDVNDLPYATVVKLENQTILRQGDILFTSASETPDECAISSVIEDSLMDGVFLDDHLFGIRLNDVNEANATYLNYYFRSEWFRKAVRKVVRGVTRHYISIPNFMKLTAPMPPLPIQEEIVRILDGFTEYTEELQTELQVELQARAKQYDYYHNSLLDFTDKDIRFMSVGELFDIKNGLNKEKSAFGKGSPIINFTDVYNKRWLAKGALKGLVEVTEDEIERYSAKKGDVFFTRTSETKEDIGMSSTLIEDIPNCVFSGFVLRARPTTDLLLPKFCSYYFSTHKVRNTIVRYAAFTTRATTTGPKLSKIMVPIIPIEEQQRIVDILDRFDILRNDISEALLAEKEARRKQYEYYRDKLFEF